VSTTFIDRLYVMHFVNRNIPPDFKASFTQGMLGNIKLSNFSPLPTIMFFMVTAMLFIILPAGYGFMFGTVTTFSYGSRATGVSAGFQW